MKLDIRSYSSWRDLFVLVVVVIFFIFATKNVLRGWLHNSSLYRSGFRMYSQTMWILRGGVWGNYHDHAGTSHSTSSNRWFEVLQSLKCAEEIWSNPNIHQVTWVLSYRRKIQREHLNLVEVIFFLFVPIWSGLIVCWYKLAINRKDKCLNQNF